MARATSARRTGRPVQLRPGMSTVESAKVVELADGRYRMQWYVCLPTGKVVHKKIERRARRKADIRDRARAHGRASAHGRRVGPRWMEGQL
ncbi:MAG: hypothetical protein I3I99_08555 [Olsenella umbonata]|nr:hypothetical protein [Parafannyhessea umbonata]